MGLIFQKKSEKPKVYVGMSGGVDSSVSAALLKERGFDVTGVFIKVWQPDWIECTWKDDRRDAMRVCAKLKIPFMTLDLEDTYKQEVVDYMINEYKLGRTPNPDVMCNKYVKFGGFFSWAIAQGADYVATGHYARVEQKDGLYMLKTGRDKNKDQSYFLWTLTQEHLSRTLFPVGDIEKPKVRKLAEQFGLPTATKKDSQGICFIGNIDMKDFLSHYITAQPGNVLNEAGEVIGHHNGAIFLTIGERHGFTIDKKTPNDEPSYIISKNVEANTVTVSHKNSSEHPASAKTLCISHENWTLGHSPEPGLALTARARYRQPLTPISVASNDCFEFDAPQDYLAPGQSLVIYDGDICLGGGIIE
ncbi:MAG: tRNA 2-thiouridine(34) synthase MnmA [Patescibacteria group bacterium]